MPTLYYISSNKYSLQERMTKRGKVYDVRFRVVTLDGHEQPKKLCGYHTKALAKEAYLQFITENCELVKRNPLKKKNPKKENLLVGDLVRQYLSTLGNQKKQRVIYDKNNVFRCYVLPFYNDTAIDNLTSEELYKWQDKIWNTRNSKTGEFFSFSYLTKIRGNFSNFLSWVEERYGFKNNFDSVKKPKRRQQQKEMKIWTREQFNSFISNVSDPMYHALFTFMFYTGRRKGELFALYKTDIKGDKITFDKSVNRRHFGQNTWEITTTKEDKSCTIPICPIVQEEIKSYIPKKGKFYFGGEEPLPPTTVERMFKRYTEIAGLPPIRLHDLRHSFASLLISNGANITVVATLLSDTVEMVTKTYAHLTEGDERIVLSKIK